ncbi:MAG: PEP-CTERM sorting domain-containing protein, partial [Akkermansia sp.]|nr:PEP-CTERM sorting domain-containing protein [Akkermansia sp.]
MGDSGNDFNPGAWQALTLAGGTMTDTNGLTLTSAREGNVTLHAWEAAPTEENPNAGDYTGAIYTNDSLEATAANYGKYLLGADKKGIYVQYVKADIVPEPTTATLSLLALAGLAARRRRR